jgi:hypothetical protein
MPATRRSQFDSGIAPSFSLQVSAVAKISDLPNHERYLRANAEAKPASNRRNLVMTSDKRTAIVNGPGVGTRAIIGLAALGAITFIVLAAFPYRAMFGSEETARQTLQDFQFAYWPRRGWLMLHIAGGLVALLSGPLQLWLGLHHVKVRLHRKLGMVYMAGMTIGSIGAIALAFKRISVSSLDPDCSSWQWPGSRRRLSRTLQSGEISSISTANGRSGVML